MAGFWDWYYSFRDEQKANVGQHSGYPLRDPELPPYARGGSNTTPSDWNQTINLTQNFQDEYQIAQQSQLDSRGLPIDWDYRYATSGPFGQALPQGAQGWDPYGRPDFGTGPLGWLKREWAEITGKVDVPEDQREAVKPIDDDDFDKFQHGLWDEKDYGKWLGAWFGRATGELRYKWTELEYSEKSPSAISVGSRVIGTAFTGLGEGLNQLARGAERLISPTMITGDEYIRAGRTAIDQEWLTKLNKIPIIREGTKLLIGAVARLDDPEFEDLADEYRDAQIWRMGYSAALDVMTRKEYMRRYTQGHEDPRFLAMELENPAAELWGQLVFDPLNIAGAWFAKLNKARVASRVGARGTRAANFFGKVMDDIGGIANLADEFADAPKFGGIVEKVQSGFRAAKGDLADLAGRRGIATLTSMGKRTEYMADSGHFLNTMSQHFAGNTDEFLEYLSSMVKIAGDNVDEVTEGLATLGRVTKDASIMEMSFSEMGSKTALILRNILTDSKTGELIDASKLFGKLEDGADMAAFAEKAAQKIASSTERIFPTLTEQISRHDELLELITKHGDEADEVVEFLRRNPGADVPVPGRWRAMDKAHQTAQRFIYRPAAAVQGVLYMGLSPAYWLRNKFTNFAQIFVDMGPKAAFKSFFSPIEAAKEIEQYLGFLPKIEGFGGAASFTGKPGDGILNFFSRQAASDEAAAATHVMATSIRDTMSKGLIEGRIIPSTQNLFSFSNDVREGLVRLAKRFNGDADEVLKAMRAGNFDTARNLMFLADNDITDMRKLGFYDRMLSEVLEAEDLQIALNSLDNIADDYAKAAAEHAKQPTPVADLNELNSRIDDVTAGVLTTAQRETLKDLIAKKYHANEIARISADKGLDAIRNEALITLGRELPAEQANRISETITSAFDGLIDNLGTQARTKHNTALAQARDFTKLARKVDDPSMLRRIWFESGLQETFGNMPADISSKELINRIWENLYPNKRDAIWNNHRDAYIGVRQQEAFAWVTQLQEEGVDFPWEKLDSAFDQTELDYAVARSLDNAVMRDGKLYVRYTPEMEYMELNKRLWDPATPREELADIRARMAEIDAVKRPVAPDEIEQLPSAAPEAGRVVEPFEMTREEFFDALKSSRTEFKDIEIELFGEEAAKRYRSAQATINSPMAGIDQAKYERASKLIDDMEAGLTEAQRNRLFGIGDETRGYEELKEFRSAFDVLDDAPDDLLIDEVRRNIAAIAPEELRGFLAGTETLDDAKQIAYMKVRNASEILKARGFSSEDILQQAAQQLANQIGPEDAKFLLEEWLTKKPVVPQLEAPEAGKTPVGAIESREGFRYRGFDEPERAIGADVSSQTGRGFQWGGIYEIEIKGVSGAEIGAHHPGALRGAVEPNDVTRVFFEPLEWAEEVRASKLAEDLPKLREQFPNAEFVQVIDDVDDPGAKIAVAMDEEYRKLVDAIEEAPKLEDQFIPFEEYFADRPLPLSEDTVASPSQHAFQTRHYADELLDKARDGLKENWGSLRQYTFTPKQEKELRVWLDTMRNRKTLARSEALNIAQETRDFILHNYQKRYGVDTLLSYIYPYQFWHSRTYTKWMKRLVMEPEWVARYAKYRQFLEKSHAGLPDWWKYQLNTNELLGLDSDHPLWFNLEATLNPLYGMTGLDFSDRDRRQDWWGSTMEDLNKLGPSVWTPYQLALAVHYHNQGKEEAAAKWAGRSFTGTRFIRDATALMGFGEGKGIELDPLVNFFSGGIGPYERARVGRVLGGFLSEGRYSEADIIDAGNTQSGPIWEEAVAAAINERAPGNIASFLLGAGFKPRSERDIQIDRMYNEIHGLRSQREFLSDEEYRRGWSDLRNAYPFMDTILLSKKSGLDRDEAYAWNVLSRIPPGATDDLAEQLGINYDDIGYFYESKGDLRKMPEAQRLRFMAAVLDLSALLDMPPATTRNEWEFARTTYKNMRTVGETLFGDDIWDRVDAFYASEDRDSFLRSNPIVEFALDWQQETIIQTPELAAYYTSISKIESYLKGQMYDEAEDIFGEDLWDHFEVYYRLKDANSKASRQYWKDHPQLEAYGDFKEQRLPYVAERLEELGSKIPEGLPASFREELEEPQQEITRDNDREAWLASQVVSYLGGGSGTPYYQQQISDDELRQQLGEPLYRLVMMGGPLPGAARKKLKELGLSEYIQ